MKRFFRPLIVLSYDGLAAAAAFFLAVLLRYDFVLPAWVSVPVTVWSGVFYAAVSVGVFFGLGVHRFLWRYTAARDMLLLLYAVGLSMLLAGAALFLWTRLAFFPRSALIMLGLLHVALSAAPRALMRALHDNPRFRMAGAQVQSRKASPNVLIVGVNNNTELFIREIGRQPHKSFCIRGILDDDHAKRGRMIHGVPVLGPLMTLPKVLDDLAKRHVQIEMIILSGGSYTYARDLLQIAQQRRLVIKRMPDMASLEDGERLTNLKTVLIEDLLMRPPVKLDMSVLFNLIHTKKVLVTGAGGSIGSELCRQIAQRKPANLVMADHSEFALYGIDMEMAQSYGNIARRPVLLDVKNEADVLRVMQDVKPDIVFHAAAYKHVPMVEANPVAGIENNLFGTASVATAAQKAGVERVIVISTDKAVNPTNVMGATKRASEIFCHGVQERAADGTPTGTRLTAVRFGNVLGSTGSVIPLFRTQIQSGGPVTVTHKDATRYFMTIPEAVQLVLQAATMGQGGEVFMLDMGEPVRIWDMAEEMVRLSGLRPHEDIEIKEVGLRPGEKLFEEMWYDGEVMTKTSMEKLFLVKPVEVEQSALKQGVAALRTACEAEQAGAAVAALKAFVPEYIPADNSPYKD